LAKITPKIDEKLLLGWVLMMRLIWLVFTVFTLFAADSAEVQKINGDIQQLEEMKRGYEARALRHENQAEYLQFDQQAVLETRRHLQIAQENRDKAALVQEQIDRLKEKKAELTK
jgi:hypothetical protein